MLAGMSVLFAVSISRVLNAVGAIGLLSAMVAAIPLLRRKPAAKPPLKPPWHYWFWRIYVPTVYVGFAASLVAFFMRPGDLFAWSYFVFMLFGAAVMGIINRCAFGFDYSVFGKRVRTPLPDEPALRTFANSYGIVGGVRATVPMVTWLVYREGLGIKVVLMGDVFLPWDTIDVLELQPGLFSTLYHHCREVNGLIRTPKSVARALAEALESRSPGKVIVEAELAKSWNPFRFL
jgi:hypothetical protein